MIQRMKIVLGLNLIFVELFLLNVNGIKLENIIFVHMIL